MARLNESTAPTESLDALKRRFVRQNREIARVNSIQSLRIRSLESEVSHLLSENVSLREQSISLSQELERYEAAKMLHDGVYDIKAKLDSKLAELGSLMTDLGALPRKFGKLCEENAESTIPTHSRLSSLDFKRRATASEYNTAPEDGRLPAIQEDKCYPRKTLESQELHDLIQNDQDASESPQIEEITPPGQEQESIHINPELPEGLTDFQIIDYSNTEALDNLFPTLETRKKRNSSPIAMSRTEFDLSREPATANHDLKFSLKSGAKRKFMSEDEVFASAAPEDDDFQYTRPSHLQNPTDQSASMHDKYSPTKKQVERKRGSREDGSCKRKVLEPKSTNIKATPPSKFRAPRDQKHQKSQQGPCIQDGDQKPSAAEQKAEINRQQVDVDEKCLHDDDHPVEEDRYAKPRVARQLSEENPSSPMAEVSKDEATSDFLNTQSRPTRRRGAVMSYAEPNLRDKMRRPTSEFADAVMDDRSRRTSNSQSSRTTASDGNEGDRSEGAGSKRSSHGSDANYPFVGPLPEQSMSMVSQRKRKTLPANKNDPSIHERSVEATTEKRPDSRTPRHSSVRHGQEIEDDYPVAPSTKSATRQTRRHSSNPRPFGQTNPSQESADSTAGESRYSPSQTYPKTVAAVLGHESMLAGTDEHLESDSHVQTGTSQLDMQHTTAQRMGGKQSRRGHRVATRRKSMML